MVASWAVRKVRKEVWAGVEGTLIAGVITLVAYFAVWFVERSWKNWEKPQKPDPRIEAVETELGRTKAELHKRTEKPTQVFRLAPGEMTRWVDVSQNGFMTEFAGGKVGEEVVYEGAGANYRIRGPKAPQFWYPRRVSKMRWKNEDRVPVEVSLWLF